MTYGTYEPDTTLDIPSLMRDSPPGLAKNLVYFNVYTASGPGIAGANGEIVNPNVGALRTNLDPVNSAFFEAVFGVWTDCNGDGYVGMLETAVREYDARLLLDDDVCPLVTGPKTAWTARAHNYNGWVTELIAIGNRQTTTGDDSRVYKDDAAMVWGDTGKPDDAVGAPGIQCQGRARGEAHTTGGILWQLDCQGNGVGVGVGVGATGFSAGTRIPIVRTFNDADAALGTGLGFGDDPASSSSPLNQPTFGDDESHHSAVMLQDCEAAPDPRFNTGDVPVGADFDNIQLLRPVPGDPVNANPTSWTVPGTLNYTAESVYTPDGTFGPNAAGDPNDENTADCNFDNDAGQDFYEFLESNVDTPPYNGKDAPWTNFIFQTGSRGTLPATFYPAGGISASGGSGRGGVATDLGIEALGVMCTASSCVQSMWRGPFISFTSPILDTKYDINEDNPAASTASTGIAKAPYFTFYAYTGQATADRGLVGPGGSGVYGSAQCGDNDSGTHNGWNCDRAAWYRRVDGTYPPENRPFARVGDPYNHRDVECFDGRVGDTGVGAAPAFYGANPCERPS